MVAINKADGKAQWRHRLSSDKSSSIIFWRNYRIIMVFSEQKHVNYRLSAQRQPICFQQTGVWSFLKREQNHLFRSFDSLFWGLSRVFAASTHKLPLGRHETTCIILASEMLSSDYLAARHHPTIQNPSFSIRMAVKRRIPLSTSWDSMDRMSNVSAITVVLSGTLVYFTMGTSSLSSSNSRQRRSVVRHFARLEADMQPQRLFLLPAP